MNKHNAISPETQEEAMAMAKKTQKPGQSKEQTRLIALGIQKGIAEYKIQAKKKLRQANKANKKNKKQAQQTVADVAPTEVPKPKLQKLPWGLLIVSWIFFAAIYINQA